MQGELVMLRRFIEHRRKKHLEKLRLFNAAMKSEIINAIQYEVREEQKGSKINLPYFTEVQNRIDRLHITSFRDLCNVYKQFAQEGRVSGVINV